ncbi:hypothetical protein [Niveispirillum lacus]|nr:hypothetical protein [Niveispirillum lacus]
MNGGSKHKQRFDRWVRRQNKSTRFLAELVEERLLPPLSQEGFVRVNADLTDPSWKVDPYQLTMERVRGEEYDFIIIIFLNSGAPRFQVFFGTRGTLPPHNWLKSGYLVSRSKEFIHFWGKPWWRPYFTWTENSATKTVSKVESMLTQVLDFLRTGEAGMNISKREM